MDMAVAVAAVAFFVLSLYSSASVDAAFTPPCPPGFVAFGNSLTDTGNLLHLFPPLAASGNPPYGRTFFNQPTGRYCDGRLLVDFVAASFGYPFLHPYFDSIGADFRHGVDFAVAGSSANLTISSPFTLPVQVDEFVLFKQTALRTENLSSSAASQLPDDSFFEDALYIVGEIGENDLRDAILKLNLSIPEVERTIVPQVVATIVQNAKRLYAEGARNLLFVGILAQGCSPYTLTVFGTNDPDELDSLGCLKSFNDLVQVFNSQLYSAVQQVKQQLSDAAIVFADYYNASLAIFSNPSKYNFNPNLKLDACCGIGGKYNYDSQRPCGFAAVNVCSDPSIYINWDGVHFTDAFYGAIAKLFLSGQFLDPPINLITTCSLLPTN
ncbi:hypothetical protein O6H91_13G092100 [Diphasiastrum complanatum]|uniref:Uncharacterized protein n=2 Tax=Diphasiastrum complanatum TaxID=34168 RepID=A0ACC2BX39_DIPCM|nr:hypothetical protein O6H91_13G090200 [Diphasiastrum complanatum]KAJ7534395.1 hypothetical protein O6H91_13G092100 [Diphasiastrum complanatum]